MVIYAIYYPNNGSIKLCFRYSAEFVLKKFIYKKI